MATASGIPIQNIYYLLCYAWDKLSDWHRVAMNTETETDTMRNVAFID
jgi:hypothetical protein